MRVSIYYKGGVAILPNNDFIISILNLDEDDIEELDSHFEDSKIIIDLKLKDRHPDCPYCHGKTVIKDYKKVKIIIGDLNNNETMISYKKRRYVCKDCHRTFFERSNFGPKNTNVSWSTIKSIMQDVGMINETYEAIAKRNHVSATIVQRYVDSFLIVPRLTMPVSFGIDELYAPTLAMRDSDYLAIIVDNVHRSLHDILNSRSKVDLSRYFSNVPKEERYNVKYISMDLWDPYRDLAFIYFPKAKVCADPYHVVRNLIDCLNRYRIKIMNQYDNNSKAYYLLKKYDWIILKNDINFDPMNKRHYDRYLKMHINNYDVRKMIFELDDKLRIGYKLKERYIFFNKYTRSNEAKEELEEVIKEFKKYDLDYYRKFLKTLKNWKEEIINSFERPFEGGRKQSNSLSESMNRQLNTLIKVSNGLSNFNRFRARALYILNSKVHYNLTDIFYSNKNKGKRRNKYNKNNI